MKVLVDITEDLFNRIKEVNQGSSLSSFILIAIENQISLEKEQHTDLQNLGGVIKKPPEKILTKEKTLKKPSEVIDDLDFLRTPINYNKISEVLLKNPIKNGYIWGQYNKFFALKFAVRYLAYLQSESNYLAINLNEFHDRGSHAASQIKQILIQSDNKAGRVWGEGFSTGLPDNEEKSRSRFKHHFIGYLDTKGNPVGALPDIGFIVIDDGKVALSRYGLAFAKIKNPVLDENLFSPHLFTWEEQQYLIDHIKNNISIEWNGMKSVIHWINEGINSPEKLNAKFATLDSTWTSKMANTYRTGMLARMFDLGFISRKKIGVNSNYVVTDIGNKTVEAV
jgi:hypothetical protein